MRIIAVILSIVAFSLLGAVVGEFVGRSGHDAIVVSTVLPAVLTLVGGYFVFKSESTEGINSIVLSLSVIFFLTSFFVASRVAGYVADYQKIVNTEYNRKLLPECIRTELRINNAREQLGLPPLKTEVIMETICGLR